MDPDTKAEFDKHYALQEKVFDRLDGINATLQNHVTDDLQKFNLLERAVDGVNAAFRSHDETAVLKRQSHEEKSDREHRAITERVEWLVKKRDADRAANRKLFWTIAAPVVVAFIIGAVSVVVASIKAQWKLEETIKVMQENGNGH